MPRKQYRYPAGSHGMLRGVPGAGDVKPGDPPFYLDGPLDPMLARAGVILVEDAEKAAREAQNFDAVIAQLRADNAALERRARLAENRLGHFEDLVTIARDAERVAVEQLAERDAAIARLTEQVELLTAELAAARQGPAPWANAAPATVLAFANRAREAQGLEAFGGQGATRLAQAWLDDDRDRFEAQWPVEGDR